MKTINKIIRGSEIIVTIISAILITLTTAGVFVERFDYQYDGWFNTNGLMLIIIALALYAIPYIIYALAVLFEKK